MKPLLLLTLLPTLSLASPPPPPLSLSTPLPANLGVNIHFTDPRPGEMDMLAAAGFRTIRMDFSWSATEPQPGVYDFAPYDRLLASLAPHHIRPLLILDYASPLYDANLSPHTPAARHAFAQWAAAAAKHFANRGVLWEIYNEPNIGFWKPQPNTHDYIALALEVGKALKQADPHALYVGPASSTLPLPFLEDCFRAGLLDYWDAVTVHPYRQSNPESAAPDFRALRTLIERYKPKTKTIPILSGEWGYSSVWSNLSPETQAKYLPRQFLSNLASGVPLSIWYDWHDDGPDPKESEHHFGTVLYEDHPDHTPPYTPKPAYAAVQTLTHELTGYHFNKQLLTASPEDHLLLFSNDNNALKLVSWTTSPTPKPLDTPFGQLTLTDTPTYTPLTSDLAKIAAAWDRAPLDLFTHGPERPHLTLSLHNPLPHPITANGQTLPPNATATFPADFPPTLSDHPTPQTLTLDLGPLGKLSQQTHVVSLTPLTATPLPPVANILPVRISNPSAEPFTGTLLLNNTPTPLTLPKGQTHTLLRLPLPHSIDTYTVTLTDPTGAPLSGGTPKRFTPLPLTIPPTPGQSDASGSERRAAPDSPAFDLIPDGDKNIPSTQSLTLTDAPPGLPAPAPALKLTYHFDEGWKFLRLDPAHPQDLPGRPASLGLWVHADAPGDTLRCRFTDSTNQTFQPDGLPLTWTGWRYVTLPLDRLHSSSWGGAKDGRIHFPIRLTTLAIIDSAHRHATHGTIYIASPTLIYNDSNPHWTSAPASAQ